MEAFANSADAQRRLNNSIIFLGKKPVIARVYEGNMFDLRTVGNYNEVVRKDYRDDDVSCKIPPIGYMNMASGIAKFLVRDAIRDQRAGLPLETIVDSNGRQANADELGNYIYRQQGMADMLTNTYPSLAKAILMITGGEANSVAFHKTYAIDKGMRVYHRDRYILSLEVNVITGKYDVVPNSHLRKASLFVKRFNDLFKGEVDGLKAQ